MDREAVIALLKKGPEGVREFNRYRSDHPDEKISLAGENLRGADVRRADFSLTSLGGADLRGTDARKAIFHGADLSGAKFDDASLFGAVLDAAELAGTSFTGARGLKRADWERCIRETEKTIQFGD